MDCNNYINLGRKRNAAPEWAFVSTNYKQDAVANATAQNDIRNNKEYNACDNCSTFAQRVLNSAIPQKIDASQSIRPSGGSRLIYSDGKTVAPNNLYNRALKIKGAERIKGPASVVEKPYLEYYGKSNRAN